MLHSSWQRFARIKHGPDTLYRPGEFGQSLLLIQK